MKFMNKSVAMATIILSTAFNTGCMSIQKKYEVSGQSISVERKSTKRAYVDQLEVKDVNGQASISGKVIWQSSTRGPLTGKFYVHMIDDDGKTINTLEKEYSRPGHTTRQTAFNLDLGILPKSTTKLVISYGD